MGDLPRVVADALARELHGAQPDEIEEVRHEGVPILYEAEFRAPDGAAGADDELEGDENENEAEDDNDGQEREVAVLADGQPAPPGDEGQREGGISEREVKIGDVPQPVAETLRRFFKSQDSPRWTKSATKASSSSTTAKAGITRSPFTPAANWPEGRRRTAKRMVKTMTTARTTTTIDRLQTAPI